MDFDKVNDKFYRQSKDASRPPIVVAQLYP